jgi:peptidoglycan-associated lipoprotein
MRLLLLFLLIVLPACKPKATEAPTTTSGESTPGSTAPSGPSTITQQEIGTLHSNFRKVLFGFDEAALDDAARSALKENAAILDKHKDVGVQLEGHADHWGSDEYNLALGQRRADAVRAYLLDLGVTEKQVAVVSFGEERPVVGEGGKDEEAPNRRVEFRVTVGGNKVSSSY